MDHPDFAVAANTGHDRSLAEAAQLHDEFPRGSRLSESARDRRIRV